MSRKSVWIGLAAAGALTLAALITSSGGSVQYAPRPVAVRG